MLLALHPTEEKIIQAYLRLCFNRGFEKITLEKLAKESKISFATVRYHFGSADKTLEDTTLMYVLSRGYAFIQKFLDNEQSKPSYKALQSYINANFAWIQKHQEESTFLLHYFYLLATPNRERIAQLPYLQKARQRLSEAYYFDKGRGLLETVDNDKEFIVRLHNLLAGSMTISLIEGHKTSNDRHRRIVIAEIPYQEIDS